LSRLDARGGPTPESMGHKKRVSSRQPLTVLFVIGYPHSGTTILGNVLGEIDGVFHAGEIAHLWKRNLLDKKGRCGCGSFVLDCALWSCILSHGLGDARRVRITHAQRQTYVRSRSIPRLLMTSQSRASEQPGLGAYLRTLSGLYQQIAAETGASVIVDSSKLAGDAAAVRLLDSDEIAVFFVHLIRDPLDVACSRQRKIVAPDRVELRLPLLVYDSCRWAALTVASAAVCRRHGKSRSLLLPYESFALHPKRSVAAILDLIDQEKPELPFVDESTVVLHTNHTLGGNRNRFKTGPVPIRPSRPAVSPRLVDRACSRALTGPVVAAL
jgi:hypothetical protein